MPVDINSPYESLTAPRLGFCFTLVFEMSILSSLFAKKIPPGIILDAGRYYALIISGL